MLYSRHEIIELVHAIAPDNAHLVIALIWFASRGDPNVVTIAGDRERYGLLQVDLAQAKAHGFTEDRWQLLNPETNLQIGAQLLASQGLLEYCGRDLGAQIPSITRLADWLAKQASQTSTSD